MPRRALNDEQRAERQRQQRELVERSVQQLRDSDGWQRWLATRKAFRRYSPRNTLLIAVQCPHATHVAGFRKWLALGYSVKRGEQGLYIFAPVAPSKKRLAEWEAAGRPAANKPRTVFKLTAVFDRSQVQELPPPAVAADLQPPITPVTGDQLADAVSALSALAQSCGYQVAFEAIEGAASGYCDAAAHKLAVDHELTANGQATVLMHELAHMLVRVDHRDGDPEMDYATEEWVAESVAYMVADTLGLDTSKHSTAYLASWSEGRDLEALQRTAMLVDRLARRIEDAVLADEPADTVPA